MKLCLFKVANLDACIRPFFANSQLVILEMFASTQQNKMTIESFQPVHQLKEPLFSFRVTTNIVCTIMLHPQTESEYFKISGYYSEIILFSLVSHLMDQDECSTKASVLINSTAA